MGSAFGAGWPLGWCVCAGRRVLGRAGRSAGLGAVGGAWGSAALRRALSGGSDEQGQVADVSQGGGEGRGPGPVERQAQSVAAAVVEEACGHCEEPLRTVAATVRCALWWRCPRRAVQRRRLWASAAQASQAPLAKNRPEGQRRRPLSLRSLMASSTRAWPRW